METLSYSTPKANKEHKCNYCFNTIIKGEIYNKSSHTHEGSVYTWKSHKRCQELASDLGWFDECTDGLTEDAFREYVQYAFQDLHIKFDREHYESEDFEYPSFLDQLDFVIKNKSFITQNL